MEVAGDPMEVGVEAWHDVDRMMKDRSSGRHCPICTGRSQLSAFSGI